MPSPPNRLDKAGIELATGKENFSRDTAHNDRIAMVDSDRITCYNNLMTIVHMTLAELANLVDNDQLFMDLVSEGVITLDNGTERIEIIDLAR